MAERVFAYVDGESHFIRTENAWCSIHGKAAALSRLRYIDQKDSRLVLAIPNAKVFWTRKLSPGAHRTVYFTSTVCNRETMHELKISLREFNLESHIIPEAK